MGQIQFLPASYCVTLGALFKSSLKWGQHWKKEEEKMIEPFSVSSSVRGTEM